MHRFNAILAPLVGKVMKNDARMVPKKDVSSKWANTEATRDKKKKKRKGEEKQVRKSGSE